MAVGPKGPWAFPTPLPHCSWLMTLPRISHSPAVIGGKPCIRGLRITVGTVVGLLASSGRERILQAYPPSEATDIDEALVWPPGAGTPLLQPA